MIWSGRFRSCNLDLKCQPPASSERRLYLGLPIGRYDGVGRGRNLIRGASGVAVQNFNRMFGFEEGMGLL